MYKLLYGKCVCFLLLVMMVSFLRCSGFRIDRVTATMDLMPEEESLYGSSDNSDSSVSHRNNSNHYSGSRGDSKSSSSDSMDYFHRVFGSDSTSSRLSERTSFPVSHNSSSPQPHRHRHRRSRQSHHPHKSSPPYVPRSYNYMKELQTYPHQSPKLPIVNHPEASRTPRPPPLKKHHNSNKTNNRNTNNRKRKHQRKNNGTRNGSCQQQNVARKAYLANTVVLASALSMNSERVHNYSVTFRIQNPSMHVYKKLSYVDSDIRLTFLNSTEKINCETQKRTHNGPVKAQIKSSKKYFLFLNRTGSHEYTVIGMPVLYRQKNLEDIKRVTNSTFVPWFHAPTISVVNTSAQIGTAVHDRSAAERQQLDAKLGQKIRLDCLVQGFPIPLISWERNHTKITNNNTRIIYRKRRATLVIKQARPQDSGAYKCVAHGVDGTRKTSSIADIRISNSTPCSTAYDSDFCQNGGTCRYEELTKVYYCICTDEFIGEKCEQKTVNETAVEMEQKKYVLG